MSQAQTAAIAFFALSLPSLGQAEVATDQRQVAIGYERLETLALRIADAVQATDEARAEQIRTAIGQARTAGVTARFDKVVALLERQRYQAARSDQQELATQLEELLRLVMADPRESRLERERERLELLRREIRSALREQRSLRSLQQRGDGAQAAPRQEELAKRIERLREPAEEADRLAGRAAQELAGPPSGNEPPAGAPIGQPPSESQGSIAKQLEASREAMRQASEKLAEEEESAGEDQRRAQRELEAAQREAEDRLRQIREEQQQRRLASLAERFRRLHEAQLSVLTDTEEQVAAQTEGRSTPSRATELAAAQLAQREAEIGETAEKALRLIRADGSSVVFDDALSAALQDIRAAEERLRRAQFDGPTVALEQSVVEALAEMIAAVDESLDELEQRRRESGGGGPAPSGGDPGLISKIAELRMVRARQARLLSQTKRWRDAAARGEATTAEVRERLASLAKQQKGLANAAEAAANPAP